MSAPKPRYIEATSGLLIDARASSTLDMYTNRLRKEVSPSLKVIRNVKRDEYVVIHEYAEFAFEKPKRTIVAIFDHIGEDLVTEVRRIWDRQRRNPLGHIDEIEKAEDAEDAAKRKKWSVKAEEIADELTPYYSRLLDIPRPVYIGSHYSDKEG